MHWYNVICFIYLFIFFYLQIGAVNCLCTLFYKVVLLLPKNRNKICSLFYKVKGKVIIITTTTTKLQQKVFDKVNIWNDKVLITFIFVLTFYLHVYCEL